MQRREDPRLGTILGNTVLDTPPLQVRGRLVPPYPDIVRVPVARIPGPPLLDPKLGPRRRRSSLARWFRCAVESRFGKSKAASAAFSRSPKVEALLDRAAALFVEHSISPAGWCAWCCDLRIELTDDGKKPKPPTIYWVFAEKWIVERRGWYRSENRYLGGRVVASSALRLLEDRWHSMNDELRRSRAFTDDDQRPIVERWFPRDLYDRLVALAHKQASETQRLLNDLARSGDKWLW